MREIRFRGIRIDNGNWIYGWLFGFKETLFILEFPSLNPGCPVVPETFGQSIGLKDENGVDIYEGDIVNCCGGEFCQGFWEFQKKYIVEWHGVGFNLVDVESNFEIGYDFVNVFEHFEVMGNKYENPELLECGGKEKSK